jgi:hypothetical protein
VSFIIFLVVEKRNSRPMFDFSVFRIRNFSGALLGSMGMNFSFWPFTIYLPIFFQVLWVMAASPLDCRSWPIRCLHLWFPQ